MTIVYGCFRLVQTVPDAILKWVGGRDDDSIGVEDHNNKAMVLAYGQTNTGVSSAASAIAARDAEKKREEAMKNSGANRQAEASAGKSQTESLNKQLSPGSTNATKSIDD